MQDVRKMSSRSRMNLPGTVGVNWRWCLKDESHREEDAKFLRELAEKYER